MFPYSGQHAGSGSSRYDGQSDTSMYQAVTPLGSSGAVAHGISNAGGATAPPAVGGMPRPGQDGSMTSGGMMSGSSGRPSFSRQGSDIYSPQQQQQAYTPTHDTAHRLPGSSSGLPSGTMQQQQQQQQQQQPGGGAGGAGNNNVRPLVPSANTAPSSVPQLPPITTQAGSYQPSSRGSTAHSYSRSSPDSRFPATPGRSQMQSQTPQNAPFSPLGLADIRSQMEGGSDELQNAYPYENQQPGNCQYLAPWPMYAFDWCKWPAQSNDSAGKMAIGSYLEDGHNYIQVLDTKIVPDADPEQVPGASKYGIEYVKTAEATHAYPVTRILWEPQSSAKKTCDLLATSGDHLRLWSLPQPKGGNYSNSITSPGRGQTDIQKLSPLALLSNSKSPEHTAPLTSLDWNTLSPSLIITSSIDTTCTIWDIPSLTAKTQLIAHDKEVFDVRFCANSVDVFVSCGADGSVRMFDLRSLEHSTIIYEPSEKDSKSSGDASSPTKTSLVPAQPLLRLAASPHDSHLLATFSQDSAVIRILDVRQPGQALLELQGHQASINCIEWAPSRRGMLASGADDSMVLIWDLLNPQSGISGVNGGAPGAPPGAGGMGSDRMPVAAWSCDYEVNNISWAPKSNLTGQGTDWLGVSGGRGVWGLSV